MSSLFVALVLAAVPAPQVHPREVPVAVYTKKEIPVEDLRLEEIEIKENKKKRTVLSVERDERPVDVAVILDSSQQIEGEYRASLVPAAMSFWKGLPAHARLTIWTCGGKVSHAVDFGTEPEAAEATLQMVAVGGPVFALDTLIDASQHLQRAGAKRRVVVLVTDATIQANQTLINRAYAAVARTRVTPMIVLIKGTMNMGQDWDVETIFERMAEGYGGSYERSLSPSAAHKWLARAAADISSQYLVRYESEATEPLRPEVKVKRKGVLVRAGLAEIAN
jgi:hypothetical protein